MKTMKRMWPVVALLTLLGAAADDVSTQYDKTYNFANLKTFSAKIATSWGNPIMEPVVVREIEEGLVARGWQKAPEDQADATVLIHGSTKQKQELTTFYTGGYYGGWGWGGGWGPGYGGTSTTVHTYTEGTLLVDIFDSKTKQLVWRGTVKDELKKKQDAREKQVEKAGERLFKNFPPGRAN
jgi:hypothetical protein